MIVCDLHLFLISIIESPLAGDIVDFLIKQLTYFQKKKKKLHIYNTLQSFLSE